LQLGKVAGLAASILRDLFSKRAPRIAGIWT
jgi:hypothetical protein